MKASLAWMLIPALLLGGCRRTIHLSRAQVESRLRVMPPAGQVDVTIFCPGDSAKVNPWSRTVYQDSSVRWRLTGADSLRITPSDSAAWPFAIAQPVGTSDSMAVSGAMKKVPPGGTVIHYLITTHCGRNTLIIDPELIITPPV